MPNDPNRRRVNAPPTTSIRAARQYAEVLYQALRNWRTEEAETVLFDYGPSNSGTFRLVGVALSSRPSSSTVISESMLTLPWGSVPERNFGLVMLDLLNSGNSDLILYGKLLARVQTGVSPATLVDERGGWRFPREKSIRYALAVLYFALMQGQAEASDFIGRLLDHLQESQD